MCTDMIYICVKCSIPVCTLSLDNSECSIRVVNREFPITYLCCLDVLKTCVTLKYICHTNTRTVGHPV